MKEKAIDFGNERVSVLFKKLFFPTLLGMLSMSAVTTIDVISWDTAWAATGLQL